MPTEPFQPQDATVLKFGYGKAAEREGKSEDLPERSRSLRGPRIVQRSSGAFL